MSSGVAPVSASSNSARKALCAPRPDLAQPPQYSAQWLGCQTEGNRLAKIYCPGIPRRPHHLTRLGRLGQSERHTLPLVGNSRLHLRRDNSDWAEKAPAFLARLLVCTLPNQRHHPNNKEIWGADDAVGFAASGLITKFNATIGLVVVLQHIGIKLKLDNAG